MYGLMRDSVVVGVAKRAARPVRRAGRSRGRGRVNIEQRWSLYDIVMLVIALFRGDLSDFLRERGVGWAPTTRAR